MRSNAARWIGTAIAAVVAISLTACGSGGAAAGGPVELNFIWWGDETRAQATDAAVKLFEQQNPAITVKTSFSPFDSYFDKLATQVSGGGAPDVLQMDKSYLREYGDRGALVDLGQYAGSAIRTDQIPPSLLAASRAGDTQYAVPFGSATQALIYDPAVWQAAGVPLPKNGWTWSDFEAATKAISASTGGQRYGVADFGYAIDWLEFWLRQQGKTAYTENGLGFTEADLVRFWQFTRGLRDAGAASPPELTTQIAAATNPQVNLQVASAFNYDSTFSQSFKLYNGSAAMAPWPTDTGKSGMYAAPPVMLSVSKRSAHPAEAAKLIDFLLNDVEAGKLLGTTRGIPANTAVRDAIAPSLTGAQQIAVKYQESVQPLWGDAPPVPPQGAGEVKRSFQQIFESVNFGRVSIEDGAAQFMAAAQKALG